METSALHSQISLFEERNMCLYFALGLVSAARILSEAVEKAQGEPLPDSQETDAVEGALQDNALYLALGVVAVSRRLDSVMEAERRRWQQRRALHEAGESASSPYRGLRDLLL